ncbi:hypothetical protein BpHYR1_018155 [Brachionus plicatilis]|uniref:Uncharacterized protein n=1 Tax=Brachionus plicatilis TaxID=10195 RepID=A0A3M7QCN0_BRAPC|nr:hypothetical protein BpHYR1_018155 [Brachionus plicatilis]
MTEQFQERIIMKKIFEIKIRYATDCKDFLESSQLILLIFHASQKNINEEYLNTHIKHISIHLRSKHTVEIRLYSFTV